MTGSGLIDSPRDRTLALFIHHCAPFFQGWLVLMYEMLLIFTLSSGNVNATSHATSRPGGIASLDHRLMAVNHPVSDVTSVV
jgi:hypothetical protein